MVSVGYFWGSDVRVFPQEIVCTPPNQLYIEPKALAVYKKKGQIRETVKIVVHAANLVIEAGILTYDIRYDEAEEFHLIPGLVSGESEEGGGEGPLEQILSSSSTLTDEGFRILVIVVCVLSLIAAVGVGCKYCSNKTVL